MNTLQMRDKLRERLSHLDVDFKFNREGETLRIYQADNNRSITIKPNAIVAKYGDKKEKTVDEIVYYVDETTVQMADKAFGSISSSQVMSVIRATSFDKKTKQGVPFVHGEYTTETAVYYIADLEKSYRLTDENTLEDLKLIEQQIREVSLFNVRKLLNLYTTDEAKGNIFYFINSNDGYDASRILNTTFLNEIRARCQGEVLVAVPYQDVLIIADIRSKTRYNVMAHLTVEFFTKGLVLITSLSFRYKQDHLEPMFILGKSNKRKGDPNVIQRLEANRHKFNKDK